MQYRFLNIFFTQEELLTRAQSEINPFLLENNTSQLEKMYDFFKGSKGLLYVNGFLGTGKASLVKVATLFLSLDSIVFKYNCFNSTVLDDILLSFFIEFKKLSAQKIISEPKVKTESFNQKIDSYFAQIEKPFVIILDSFESILDENKKEIADFIFHLSTFKKIKIIIISRIFEGKYFEGRDVERVSVFALEKKIFENYLKSEKIKAQAGIIDEFYKHTRGYYFFTKLSFNIMSNENLSIVDFLLKLKESYLQFPEFIAKRALEMLPPSSRNLFWFLALIRSSVSVDLLTKLNLYDEEKIEFLESKMLINKVDDQIYVPDFFKEYIEDSQAPGIFQKIRQYIVDLYQTQLPLKPLERNICISRQTMRKEVEYHKLFLPKKPRNVGNRPIDINYLSYATIGDFAEKTKVDEGACEPVEKSAGIDLTQRKNININIENLPFQASQKISEQESDLDEPIMNHRSLESVFEELKTEESGYNYPQVIELGKKALLMKTDESYKIYIPEIYMKLAHAYQKIADYENALKFYILARGVFEKQGELEKVNSIKYKEAEIYYQTYKMETARELFAVIASDEHSGGNLVVKSYLQLGSIEEGLSNFSGAFDYYKKALEFAGNRVDVEVLSELYFKYALALDDKNDLNGAIEYYTKCISLGDDLNLNKFMSSSYSNIANLYAEKNDVENAALNYKKAFDTDKKANNPEGMYYSASKLASIFHRKDPTSAFEYFKIAYDCAKQTGDVFYIVSSALAFGDYYYDRNQSEYALRYYIKALELAQNKMSQDNISKIQVRLNDIKFKLGVEKYDKLAEIIKGQMNE